jgi:single-strand DNA-binding protein
MAATFEIIGNLVADPEVRFTGSGKALASFSVAYSPTRRDGSKGEVSFYNITAWEDLATNVGASFHKGDRVVVTGRISQQRWETEDGSKRNKIVFTADEVGGSVRWAVADMTKTAKANTNGDAIPSDVAEGEVVEGNADDDLFV